MQLGLEGTLGLCVVISVVVGGKQIGNMRCLWLGLRWLWLRVGGGALALVGLMPVGFDVGVGVGVGGHSLTHLMYR